MKLFAKILSAIFVITLFFSTTYKGYAGRPEINGKIPDFNCVDLLGNKVTNSIFKNKSMTMIVLWGTF